MHDEDFQSMMTGLAEARAYRAGDQGKTVTHEPLAVDVKAIRAKTRLPQAKFASIYHLSVATVREWEQNRRVPEGAARTLLKLIETDPVAVANMLAKAS